GGSSTITSSSTWRRRLSVSYVPGGSPSQLLVNTCTTSGPFQLICAEVPLSLPGLVSRSVPSLARYALCPPRLSSSSSAARSPGWRSSRSSSSHRPVPGDGAGLCARRSAAHPLSTPPLVSSAPSASSHAPHGVTVP